MLMHDLPGEPITSDHYVTGTWVWQEWALSIGLAVCGLLVIAWVVPFLISGCKTDGMIGGDG